METKEQFHLSWNDFETNISSAFRELRHNKELFDITLVCAEEQVQAHKVVLAACSPFFRTLLKKNPHSHPLLYMSGVKLSELVSVLDFMYHGQVEVAQNELNNFLITAENLKVKGLMNEEKGTQKNKTKATREFKKKEGEVKTLSTLLTVNALKENKGVDERFQDSEVPLPNNKLTTKSLKNPSSVERDSLFLPQMISPKKGKTKDWQCRYCGKFYKKRALVRDHVESMHMNKSFEYHCRYCIKLFNTYLKLNNHEASCKRFYEAVDEEKCNFALVKLEQERGNNESFEDTNQLSGGNGCGGKGFHGAQ